MRSFFQHLCALFSVCALTLPAFGTSSPNSLTIGLYGTVKKTNPLLTSSETETYAVGFTNHPLLALDSSRRWRCLLCKEVPTLENGLVEIVEENKKKKKLVINWEIKDNAKWGDGKPITGEDVRFAWEVAIDKSVAVKNRELYLQIESISVDINNPKKFSVRFHQIRNDHLIQGLFHLLPSHIERPIYEKNLAVDGGYASQTSYRRRPETPGLYCGPYLVERKERNSRLKRNPHFYGNAAKIESIVIKSLPLNSNPLKPVFSNSIDVLAEVGLGTDRVIGITAEITTKLSLQDKFTIVDGDSNIYEHIDINLRNPILSDINVRKALILSIDRDKLSNLVYHGLASKTLSMVHPKDAFYLSDIPSYSFQIEKAAKLLESVGWKRGKNGILEKDEKELVVELTTTKTSKSRLLTQKYLKSQWEKLGIKVITRSEIPKKFFGDIIKKARYKGLALYGWHLIPEGSQRSSLHSKEIPTIQNDYKGQNSGGWQNKNVDKALAKLAQEFEFEKRQEFMHLIQREYTSQIPVIPLFMHPLIAVIPKALTGYKITGHIFPTSLFVSNWKFSK